MKVIAHSDSPYVYLFDREKQTFTVYNSSPVKTHDNHKTNFQLYYLFRFKFALTQGEQKIYDVTIPPAIGNRPELYLLSDAGVSKINLYDIIDAALKNKNRKAE